MKTQQGFSLIEGILVVAVLGSLVLLLVNLPNAIGLISKSNRLNIAREIATKELENRRNMAYDDLPDEDEIEISDSRLLDLPEGSGSVVIGPCPEEVCTNNESVKYLTITVHWKQGENQQEVKLSTMISPGGISQ